MFRGKKATWGESGNFCLVYISAESQTTIRSGYFGIPSKPYWRKGLYLLSGGSHIFLKIVTEIVSHAFEQSTEGVFYIDLLLDICTGFSSEFSEVKVTHCLAAKPLNKRK